MDHRWAREKFIHWTGKKFHLGGFPCTFCVIEITHGHGNFIWPHISQMAWQIEKLKPLYEVKLLILLTGAHFWCKIPMFWLFSRNFFSISFCCSQNVWVPLTRFQARARARTHARTRALAPSFLLFSQQTHWETCKMHSARMTRICLWDLFNWWCN